VKSPAVLAALADAPRLADFLCDECRVHFQRVQDHLRAYGVPFELEERLVRGLDYYTRTAWEFVGPDEGAQSSISGGGRYDGLVEEIGGPPTPGVGFGAEGSAHAGRTARRPNGGDRRQRGISRSPAR
jgi:histidyl-tRNA synthetase